MRDLLLTVVVFGSIPFILRNPFIGLLMWVWLGIMNPHRLTWGFAYNMPFAQVIAICFLTSILVNLKKLNKFPTDPASITLVFFVLWLGVSPLFSFHFNDELNLWLRAFKIQFIGLIALLVLSNREQLHKLVWVLALSIGFFGIKGGMFTIATAGHHRVWGPEGSFIADNNSLALAIIMAVPLFRYLQLHSNNKWVKRGCLAAMTLCTVAAIGSYSRGAFLALLAMALFLWTKSRQKGLIGILALVAIPAAWLVMPEHWTGRMSSIQTYEQDTSALGRFNAWWTAWNIAVDRFPIGAGFAMYEPDVFARYAPDPLAIHAAHSIYFQVLGEHGFMGLSLFLMIFGFSWLSASWIIHNTIGRPGLEWSYDLAAMCQVSLVGYAIGGAFLSLTYFDLPYFIVIILIVLRGLVRKELGLQAPLQKRVPI